MPLLLPQLLGKLYDRVDEIYYMAYPVKAYYMANPKAEPADYAEKVITATLSPCVCRTPYTSKITSYIPDRFTFVFTV